MHRCQVRLARATSAVSRIRVLWNTVSSTIRRPGAIQYVTLIASRRDGTQLAQLAVKLPAVRLAQ
jgi:hypothetical protein